MGDYNYYSVGASSITVNAGGPDTYNVDKLPDDLVFAPDPNKKHSDILKFSQSVDQTLDGVTVSQGLEDAVDMNNRCRNIVLKGDFGVNGWKGLHAFTIKGGVENIRISGLIHSRGSETDVDIGGWSDQCYNLSKNIFVDVKHSDGNPVRVRIGRATSVTLGAGCKENKLASLGLTTYWWFKWLVRKVMGIKVGEHGPSWL